jgi:antitoxin MazE
MKARLVRIGNSRGVRLPKPLIEEARLGEDVEISARDGEIVIRCAESPRHGWREAAELLRERREGDLLDAPTPTRFDDVEWEW